MVLKAGIWGADMPTAAHFLLRYAYEQTMVSAVWGMQDPVTIATAMGLEPAAVLRPSIATGVAPSEPEYFEDEIGAHVEVRGERLVDDARTHEWFSFTLRVRDDNGRTPLELATHLGHSTVVVILTTFERMPGG